jgi:catechol 2,3-dioxygenase-like lactoylglutathione lyase family enzyme
MLAAFIIVERRAAMITSPEALFVLTATYRLFNIDTRSGHKPQEGRTMAFTLNHVHLKTHDPEKTAKFYVDTLGAKMVGEAGNGGYRLDLHGLSLNVTNFVESQTREQKYGMEHFALNTDDLDGTIAKLTASGAHVLEQMVSGNGRRICFLEGPDGVQLEIIEMKG